MATIYAIEIDGNPVTSAFAPLLIELTITDSDGGKTDTCEIKLDDSGGQIDLPRSGADIVATLWRDDAEGAVTFVGKTDEPRSHGSRESGTILTITAHSADLKGKGKEKRHRHRDGGTFAEAARDFGAAAGFSVAVDPTLGALTRGYWAMSNESFFAWGQRMAGEIGATFKVRGTQAVFADRNGTSSVSGQALAPVEATAGDNLISWEITPVTARAAYDEATARWYDPKAAKWNVEREEVDSEGEGDGR